MKKALSILLVIGILMSFMVIGVSAEEEVTLAPAQISLAKMKKADVNKDGSYSTSDVQALLQAVIGAVENSDSAEYDINSDGCVSFEDAREVLRHVSGAEPIVSDEELVEIVNFKLNAVKTDKPTFHGVSTVQCKSMKVTQKVTASNAIVGALLGDMNFTDLEYDKYIEKMIAMMEDSKELTEEDLKEIEAMRNSAETYRDPVVGERTVDAAESPYGHLLYFPRERKNVACELTVNDIKSVTYSVRNGVITINIVMPTAPYTASTYPSDLTKTPYGKAFNVANLKGSSDSTLTKGEYKNGKLTLALDKETEMIQLADYSYEYYSEVKAPTQSQTDPKIGTVTIDMVTKTSASVKETFTF